MPGPNSLWHLDGCHKLIRWGFVIHGGIDGYSRLITYLRVCTNNRSGTVLNVFWKQCMNIDFPLECVLIMEGKIFRLLNLC